MTNSKTVRVLGYVVARRETAKAWHWTCVEIRQDGNDWIPYNADTIWLPKSQCSNVRVFETVESTDGFKTLMVEAEIPVWLFNKLDARPGWVRRGERHAPIAQLAY